MTSLPSVPASLEDNDANSRVGPLTDPYTMRSLEEQKGKALDYWTFRTKILCVIQIVCFEMIHFFII